MAASVEASSSSSKSKPVVLRVKRKASQERLEAFWLEINERPLKRPLLGLESLSISDSPRKVVEESRTKKLLVQHIETISGSEGIKDVLQSFLSDAGGSEEFRRKIEGRRGMLKQDKKQDQLRSMARLKHENLVRSARFEQIWKSRRGRMDTADDSLHEICNLYDVVRVDSEEEVPVDVQEPENVSVEDNAILCNYLPLLREFLPTAAAEIESDMIAYVSKQDNYVYDLYTVDDGLNKDYGDASTEYPLIQVDEDDDYYDGPLQSDYETDDSNAEDNPLFDYPDEESSGDKESERGNNFDDFEGSDSQYYEETDDDDVVDRRWGHR